MTGHSDLRALELAWPFPDRYAEHRVIWDLIAEVRMEREFKAREIDGWQEVFDFADSTIDRIDTALRGDGRSAMRVVTAQEIINQYREGQEFHE